MQGRLSAVGSRHVRLALTAPDDVIAGAADRLRD